MARPAFAATEDLRRKVVVMGSVGVRHEDIALVLGVSEPTLRRHFRKELDTASLEANKVIAAKLFQKANAGDVACMIFWLKCRAGWRETSIVEHRGRRKSALPEWLLASLKPGKPETAD